MAYESSPRRFGRGYIRRWARLLRLDLKAAAPRSRRFATLADTLSRPFATERLAAFQTLARFRFFHAPCCKAGMQIVVDLCVDVFWVVHDPINYFFYIIGMPALRKLPGGLPMILSSLQDTGFSGAWRP